MKTTYIDLLVNLRTMRDAIASCESNPDDASVYFLPFYRDALREAQEALHNYVAAQLQAGNVFDPLSGEWVKPAMTVKNNVSPLTVTDRNGVSHAVLAAKRIDSFRVLVIHETAGHMPFVVHTFNESDGGFHCGHYCESLARAFEVFNADKRAEWYAAIPVVV